MIDHGQHQRLWEALVELAATHSAGPCHDEHCPAVQAVIHEQHALIAASAADPILAVRGLIVWATPALADTLIQNARTEASDSGSLTGIAVAADGLVGVTCAYLLMARLDEDHAAVEALTRLACKHPAQGAAVAAELIRQLASALVGRHAQLSSKGAHP